MRARAAVDDSPMAFPHPASTDPVRGILATRTLRARFQPIVDLADAA